MDIFLRNLKRKYCFNFIFTVSSCDNVLNLGLVRVCSFLSVFGEKFHRRSNTSLFKLKKIHYNMSKEVYTNMAQIFPKILTCSGWADNLRKYENSFSTSNISNQSNDCIAWSNRACSRMSRNLMEKSSARI